MEVWHYFFYKTGRRHFDQVPNCFTTTNRQHSELEMIRCYYALWWFHDMSAIMLKKNPYRTLNYITLNIPVWNSRFFKKWAIYELKAFLFYFSSTELWPFCSVFWLFFVILFVSTNQYLPSKTLHWKSSNGVNLKSFSWTHFLYPKDYCPCQRTKESPADFFVIPK